MVCPFHEKSHHMGGKIMLLFVYYCLDECDSVCAVVFFVEVVLIVGDHVVP